MIKGTVKWFNIQKGYGFIITDDMQDVFGYLSSIQGEGFKRFDEGQKVTFDIVISSRGRYAANIEKR